MIVEPTVAEPLVRFMVNVVFMALLLDASLLINWLRVELPRAVVMYWAASSRPALWPNRPCTPVLFNINSPIIDVLINGTLYGMAK
jgi:hypothetical protein